MKNVLVFVLFSALTTLLLTESRPQRNIEPEDDYYNEDHGHEGDDPYYEEEAPPPRRPRGPSGGAQFGAEFDENADAPMKPMPPGVPPNYNWRSADFDHLQVGILFDVVHRLQDASRCFRAAVEFENTSLAYMNYGVSLQFLFKEEEAKAAFQRAVEMDETNELAKSFLENPEVIKRGVRPPDSVERLSGGKTAHNPGDMNKLNGAGQFQGVGGPRLWEAAEIEDSTVLPPLVMPEQTFPEAPERETLVKGRPELYAFLGSDVFMQDYFERFPVLIHAGTGFSDALTYSSLLEPQYEYGVDGLMPPHRNVAYLNGAVGEILSGAGLQTGKDLTAALERGASLHFQGVQRWLPDMAEYALDLSEQAFHLPITADVYVHAALPHAALKVHNELHCTLIAQVSGMSAFSLWIHEEVLLGVRERHLRGVGKDSIDSQRLGTPYMAATLRPGDVLYIPRGVLFEVSTQGNEPSVSLSFNINSLWMNAISFTWESFLGAGKEHHHDIITTAYYKALRKFMDSSLEYRQTIPRAALQKTSDTWKEEAKALFVKLMEEALAGEALGEIQGHMIGAVDSHNNELKNIYSVPPERRSINPPPVQEHPHPPQQSKSSVPPGMYQDDMPRSKADL